MPSDLELPPAGGPQIPENTTVPQPGAEVTPIMPQIRQSEGAMAHEEHGYSTKTPQPAEVAEAAPGMGTSIPVRIESSDKAHEIYNESHHFRRGALAQEDAAKKVPLSDQETFDEHMSAAARLHAEADRAEEEAGRQYDADHGAMNQEAGMEKDDARIEEALAKLEDAIQEARQVVNDYRSGKLQKETETGA